MPSEYADSLEEAIDRLKGHLNKYRSAGNLLAESRICNMIGRKYAELAGRQSSSNPNAKRAKVYFRAQIEISEGVGDAHGRMEGILGLGSVYEHQSKHWSALQTYERVSQIDQVACPIARLKLQMALETENELIKEHLFAEAIALLSATPPTTESLLIQARIWHERGRRDFNWDMCRRCLQQAQEHSKTWSDMCSVDGHRVLIAEQKCLQVRNKSYEQRRQVSIDAWNEALESFDRQLLRSKEVFDKADTPSRDRLSAREQMAQAYKHLALAQSHIGDLELAHTTLCLLGDFVKRNVADPEWGKEVQSMLSGLLLKQRAVKLVNQSSTFVGIEEWVDALLMLGMYEDAEASLCDRLKSWEGDGRRACWVYRKLIGIRDELGQCSKDYTRQLILLLPEGEERARLSVEHFRGK